MANQLPFVSEFKTEKKMWIIYVQDFFFILAFIVFGMIFQSSVHSKLEFWFIIYNILVGIVLSLKSRTNPGKRNYEAIFIMLSKDREIYKPVYGGRRMLKIKRSDKHV